MKVESYEIKLELRIESEDLGLKGKVECMCSIPDPGIIVFLLLCVFYCMENKISKEKYVKHKMVKCR